jgi:hypothetical protein
MRFSIPLLTVMLSSAALAAESQSPPKEPEYLWGPLVSIGLRGFGLAIDGRTPGRQFGYGLLYGGWPTLTIPSWALDEAKSNTTKVNSITMTYRRIEAHVRWHPFSHPGFRGLYFGPGAERRTMDGNADVTLTDSDTQEKSTGDYTVNVTTWFWGNKIGMLHNFGSGLVIGTELNYRYAVSTDVSVDAHGDMALDPLVKQAIEYAIKEYGVGSGFNWTIAQVGWYF